jgi:hypothetical protein
MELSVQHVSMELINETAFASPIFMRAGSDAAPEMLIK